MLKSNCMLIGNQQRLSGKALTGSIGSTVLNQVKSLWYLGVLIDSTLSWSLHITSVVSRVRSRISSMLRFGTLPPTVLYLLYSTFVLTLFDHCDMVWTPKLTAMLERVHSKFVNRLPPSFHSKFSYTLTECRRFHKAIKVFKSLHFISPTYLHRIFLYSKDVSGYVTRNINRSFLPRVNTNFGKRSFFYSGANLWQE